MTLVRRAEFPFDARTFQNEEAMNLKQVEQLMLQSLEHELGGVNLYEIALQCVVNTGLKREWEKYLAETRTHVPALESVCKALNLDSKKETAGRTIVRHNGEALVEATKMALSAGDPVAAELVACECVVLAEMKDHMNWELIGQCAKHLGSSASENRNPLAKRGQKTSIY